MKNIYLYDTLSNSKREFFPILKDKVMIYYCGPTVYNHAHIGNIRSVIVFDVLKRLMEKVGYNVLMVSNFTDIDDKIINRALEEHKTEKEVSEFYIKAYTDVTSKLNVLPLYATPKVSEHMYEIIDFINNLIQNGYAYKSGNDVFFDVTKDKEYGILSKMKIDSLDNGNRIKVNKNKHNDADFVLWKLTSDEGIKFDTPFGKGRPGWHTECVVMVNSVFKQPLIDIHGGGFDLKFPHHENEMAQSFLMNKSRLANYWMHVGFLNMDGEKMSKSLGNITNAKDVLAKYSPNAIRLFLLSSHYRSPVNYSDENMIESTNKVNKYANILQKTTYKSQLENVTLDDTLIDSEMYDKFLDALCDDLNVNNSLVYIEEATKKLTQLLRQRQLDVNSVSKLCNTLKEMLDLLGIKIEIKNLTEEDRDLYQQFKEHQANKNFEESDKIRKILMEKGVI